MFSRAFQGQDKKTYCGMSLLLVFVSPFYYSNLSPGFDVSLVICVICLAGISCVFAFLQDGVPASSSVKTLFAWSYGVGTILTLSNWPWLHDLLVAWVRDVEWRRRLGLFDLVFPGMILLPAGAIFIGVLRYPRKWPERAYLLVGLCLVMLFIGRLWFNLFQIHFAVKAGLDAVGAGLFWTPACLVVATIGLLLGCAPHELHRPSRIGTAMTLCYLTGAVLLPLGFYANVSGHDDCASAIALAIALGVSAPASFVAWKCITATFGTSRR